MKIQILFQAAFKNSGIHSKITVTKKLVTSSLNSKSHSNLEEYKWKHLMLVKVGKQNSNSNYTQAYIPEIRKSYLSNSLQKVYCLLVIIYKYKSSLATVQFKI